LRLDIRLPLGLLFLVLGALLTIFGAASNPDLYGRSLNINVNLWWGMVLLAFGFIMSLLGRRSHRGLSQSPDSTVAQSQARSSAEHQ